MFIVVIHLAIQALYKLSYFTGMPLNWTETQETNKPANIVKIPTGRRQTRLSMFELTNLSNQNQTQYLYLHRLLFFGDVIQDFRTEKRDAVFLF